MAKKPWNTIAGLNGAHRRKAVSKQELQAAINKFLKEGGTIHKLKDDLRTTPNRIVHRTASANLSQQIATLETYYD